MGVAREHVGQPAGEEPLGRLLRGAADATVQRRRRQLDEGAEADGLREPARVGLHLAVPLRMGEERREAAQPEPVDGLLECGGPARVRELEQQVALGARERETAQVVVVEGAEPAQVDLAAVQDLDGDPLLHEVLPQPEHAALHLLRPRRVVGANVRRRGDRRHAVRGRPARQLTCVLDGPRAVVEAGKDVGVEVDHGLVGYGCLVRPPLEQAFPRPAVVGVVNVTPDSFSDGGSFLRPEAAVALALGIPRGGRRARRHRR